MSAEESRHALQIHVSGVIWSSGGMRAAQSCTDRQEVSAT